MFKEEEGKPRNGVGDLSLDDAEGDDLFRQKWQGLRQEEERHKPH